MTSEIKNCLEIFDIWRLLSFSWPGDGRQGMRGQEARALASFPYFLLFSLFSHDLSNFNPYKINK